MTQKKRIMRRFRINEISAVDAPAQEHALMTMTKAKNAGDNDAIDLALGKISKLYWDVMSAAIKQGQILKSANYQIPDDAIESIKSKIIEGWAKLHPGDPDGELPAELKVLLDSIGAVWSEAFPTKAPDEDSAEKRKDTNMSKRTYTEAIDDIRKRDNCSHQEAARKARKENADEFAAWNTQPVAKAAQQEQVEKAARTVGKAMDDAIMKAVGNIRTRDKCSQFVALKTARREHPALFPEPVPMRR